jgi:hypothetical protein
MSAADINALVLASTALLLVASAIAVIRPPLRRLTPKAELILRDLARQFREELSQGAADSARLSGRSKIGGREIKAEYRKRRLWPGKVAHFLAFLRSRRGATILGVTGFVIAVLALPFLTSRFPVVTDSAGYIAVPLGALGIVLATKFLDKPYRDAHAVPMADVPWRNEPADRKLRRYSARVERATRRYARSGARNKGRMERVTAAEVCSAWWKLVIPKADSPAAAAVRSRAVVIVSGAAVCVVAVPALYLVFVIAIPKLPIREYWKSAVIVVSLFALYWLLGKSEPLLRGVAAVSARLTKLLSAALRKSWAFAGRIFRLLPGPRPARVLEPDTAPAPATAEADHSATEEGTMAPSPLSSLANLIKPITQRPTGRAQPGAKQKAAAAAAPQNGAGDADVAYEVDSLLAANPPTWQWILAAFVILVAGTAGSYFLWRALKPADFMPSSNYATYAGLFIMALAIERILEPFSGLFVPATKQKKATSRATAARAKRAQAAVTTGPRVPIAVPVGVRKAAAAEQAAAVQHAAAVQRAAAGEAAAAAERDAAVAQTAHHRSQSARAVLMWAAASVLAMLVCASLGIFLLRSVGTASPARTTEASPAPAPAKDPNRVLDLLVTGLVVGAGTKPLHDLITQIQTSSGGAKAKASSITPAS